MPWDYGVRPQPSKLFSDGLGGAPEENKVVGGAILTLANGIIFFSFSLFIGAICRSLDAEVIIISTEGEVDVNVGSFYFLLLVCVYCFICEEWLPIKEFRRFVYFLI